MTMTKQYDPDKREGIAPEAPRIVEQERMAPKIPKWIKKPMLYLVSSYLAFNICGFIMVSNSRSEGMPKSEIEEKMDDYSNQGVLVKFVLDDLSKLGRELAYLIRGDGEQEK